MFRDVQKVSVALAGVAQWIECQSVNERVAGLIPCQGTCLGCGQGPQLGACKGQAATSGCISQTSMFLSLSFSLPSHLSKSKQIKSSLKVSVIIL